MQHDIQLKKWKVLDDAMNSQNPNHLKYTSINLKQKRREKREFRPASFGRGRLLDGSCNDYPKKKNYSNRISSSKREQFESMKTSCHDYDNPLASSLRRPKSTINSCANASWQKISKRSRRNCSNIFPSPNLPRNEPNMRLSVRGTRIFGRRKSYRAYPTLKGDSRVNSTSIKCRSTSLPSELSHVESHDYEYWHSGFVQTRVRKLEEELTSKCDDKYSYSHDYEVQSLCSLKLEKILPDGDDYRIAYLSSTSQESSLDYMDDNYCTIGMGTLDVKLNKTCALTGNEDWDLTLSSTEENDSTSDDDEFFYRKYPNRNAGSYLSPNGISISHGDENFFQSVSNGKKYSYISGAGCLETPKSIKEQIHESVDRIFYDVMHCDFDIPYPSEEKQNQVTKLDNPCYSPPVIKRLNVPENDDVLQNVPCTQISSYTSPENTALNNFQNYPPNDSLDTSVKHFLPKTEDNFENQNSLKNTSTDNEQNMLVTEITLQSNPENVITNNHPVVTSGKFLEYSFRETQTAFEREEMYKSVWNDFVPNNHFHKINGFYLENEDQNLKKTNPNSNLLSCENELSHPETEKECAQNCSHVIASSSSGDAELKYDSENNVHVNNFAENQLSKSVGNSSKCIAEYKQNSELGVQLDLPQNNFWTSLTKNTLVKHEMQSSSSNNVELKSGSPFTRKFRNSKNRFKNDGRYGKKSEAEKKEKFQLGMKSLLEIELIVYEPLCTPFAEIYFITYGKKYPKKYTYKSSVPRIILRDFGSEFAFGKNFRQYFKQRNKSKISVKENKLKYISDRDTNLKGSFSAQNYNMQVTVPVLAKLRAYKNEDLHFKSITISMQNHTSVLNYVLRPEIKNQASLMSDLSTDNLFFANFRENIFLQNNYIRSFDLLKIRELSEDAVDFLQMVLSIYPSVNCTLNFDINNSNYATSIIRNIFNILFQNFSGISKQTDLLQQFLHYERENINNLNNFESIQKTIMEIKQLKSSDVRIMLECLFQLISRMVMITNVYKNQSKSVSDSNTVLKPVLLKPHNVNSCSSEIKLSRSSYVLNDFRKAFILKRLRKKTNTYISLKRNFKYFNASRCFRKSITCKYLQKKKSLIVNKKLNTLLKNVKHFRNYFEEIIKLESSYNLILGQSKTSHSKLIEQYRQISRNRNYWISSNNPKETEITIEVPHVGETPESGFAAESQPLASTSLTSSAAFVEYLFPPQLVSLHDTKKAHLSSSPIQLYFRSVPAVRRRLVDRESRFAQSGKDHKHGSFDVTTVSDAVNLTDNITVDKICPVKLCTDGYLSLLDCCDNQRITIVNHDFADYTRLGNVPEGLRQVISDQLTVSDINFNNSHFGVGQSSGFQENMATTDEDPRLVNKFSRTPGRNISKLKKFFDSREGVSSTSDITCSKTEESNLHASHSSALTDQQDMEFQSDSSKRVSNVNTEKESALNSDSVNEANGNISSEIEVKVSSDIPYCRKVSSGGDLWKNVDIGVHSSNDGLWNSDNSDSHYNHTDFRQVSNTFVSSTADLHNLIAASRVELSKKKEPELSDRSTLENYFTSFENSKPKKFVPLTSVDHSELTIDSSDIQISDNETYKSSVSSYDCDVDEMNFEEEEVTLSDTSSDEEIRCTNPPINTHYLPAYALHTIIEESCEESEQDSRGATPTNEPVTSKLERYFSWDIINESDLKRKEDDESTVYSDSLSEVSGSLNGDANKEIDPTQLASSRLEKYFTSGLVGNENYFYPDDAEFLEDAPVSDFEEDSIHQKISRSALLSSLETVCEQQTADSNENNEKDLASTYIHSSENHIASPVNKHDDSVPSNIPETSENESELDISQVNNIEIDSSKLNDTETKNELKKIEDIDLPKSEVHNHDVTDSSIDSSDVIENFKKLELEKEQPEITENVITVNIEDELTQKQTVNKEQLAVDVQAIIKKLLIYFSSSGSNSFKHNMESDYTSAWAILETEIERLIQSISPTSSLENNSCNSSTIDSNNSDYGSDTIESLDCMTDEDEATDSKNRSSAKYPIVDLFNSVYKKQSGHDFHNFNISDETLSIWKRLIQSLQKDSFCMNDNKLYDPNTEARLYIRDQIVNLMHTVTVSENRGDKIDESVLNYQEKEIDSSLLEENNELEDINEAYNVSISGSNLITCLSEGDNIVITTKTEVSEEEVSFESSKHSKISKEADEIIASDSDVDIENNSLKDLDKSLTGNSHDSDENDVLPNSHQTSDKMNVDEVDVKLGNNSIKKLKRSSDNSSNFSVFVNIELGDDVPSVTEKKSEICDEEKKLKAEQDESKRSSVHLWVSDSETIEKDIDISDQVDITNLPLPAENSSDICEPTDPQNPEKSHRDTGYYSFKSSDDSLLNDTPPPDEFMDVPNFKSLKRSVKKFPLTSTLSKSTNNINQIFSVSDTKFSTLQLKSHKSKGSNSNNSPSRQFTSLFSPTAVFKKLTGSKSK